MHSISKEAFDESNTAEAAAAAKQRKNQARIKNNKCLWRFSS